MPNQVATPPVAHCTRACTHLAQPDALQRDKVVQILPQRRRLLLGPAPVVRHRQQRLRRRRGGGNGVAAAAAQHETLAQAAELGVLELDSALLIVDGL